MRYILDEDGYIYGVSSNPIECDNKDYIEYTGTVPEGYDTIEQWATTANIRAYKIVNGQLVYDADRAAALEAEWTGCVDLSKVLSEGTIESYLLAANGYVRFTNGFQIAWITKTVTAGGNAWGNVYYSDHDLGNWAAPFETCYISTPYCNSGLYWCTITNVTATSAGTERCFRPNNGTASIYIGAIGFGKWK